jgi:hypothetical protein
MGIGDHIGDHQRHNGIHPTPRLSHAESEILDHSSAVAMQQARLAQYRSATDLSGTSKGEHLHAQSQHPMNINLLEDADLMETVMPPGEAGFTIIKTADGLIIHRISDNSIAKDLKPGDVIIALEGVDVS